MKFVSDEAKKLFDAPQSDLATLQQIETAGRHRASASCPSRRRPALRIGDRNILYTLVPISGGASGAVLVFREADPMNASHASFVTYVRETVFGPLRALRESLLAASRTRQAIRCFADSAATIDQILSSLELAPEVEETQPARPVPTVTEVVQPRRRSLPRRSPI